MRRVTLLVLPVSPTGDRCSRTPITGLCCGSGSTRNPHRLGWGFAYSMPFALISVIITAMADVSVYPKEVRCWS